MQKPLPAGLVVEDWPLERIKPYQDNPRTIPQAAVEKVARSIQEFGWRQPIVVDRAGVVIVGHVRRLAALRLQLETAPVHVARGLSAKKAKAYRLADNRTAEESSWDKDALVGELASLHDMGIDGLDLGFDPAELSNVIPNFQPVDGNEVKPLDRMLEVDCPKCGHRFERRAR